MTRALLSVALASILTSASAASAQAPVLGLGRRLGDPAGRARGEPAHGAEGARPEGPWPGPQIQLGYAYSKIADGYGGGDTHAAAVEVFVHWPIPQLRTGFLGEAGGRDYSLGGDDLYIRASVAIGFQLTDLLEPLLPHVAVVGTGGGIVGRRFDTTVAYGFGGAGIELGATLRIWRNLNVAATLSYLRLEMDGAAFDVFVFRAALGL